MYSETIKELKYKKEQFEALPGYCNKVLKPMTDIQIIMLALTYILSIGEEKSFDNNALWTELARRSNLAELPCYETYKKKQENQ